MNKYDFFPCVRYIWRQFIELSHLTGPRVYKLAPVIFVGGRRFSYECIKCNVVSMITHIVAVVHILPEDILLILKISEQLFLISWKHICLRCRQVVRWIVFTWLMLWWQRNAKYVYVYGTHCVSPDFSLTHLAVFLTFFCRVQRSEKH